MKHDKYIRTSIATILLGTLLLAGCSGSDSLPVAGRITVGGQPVDLGLVVFEAADGSQFAGGAAIDGGQFRFAPDAGLPPGEYWVSATALRRTGRMIDDPQSVEPVEELVPIDMKQEKLSISLMAKNSQDIEIDFAPGQPSIE